MKASSRSAAQLIKIIKRGFHPEAAAKALAERIERGPIRSCVPHKKRKPFLYGLKEL